MIVKKMKLVQDQISAIEAGAFVVAANKYDCEVLLVNGNKKANGKSIMGLLSLTLKKGDTFILSLDGKQEKEASKELGRLL